MFLEDRVVGAIGIWPLSERCARRLAAGRIKESEITGRMMRGRKPAGCWYVSGIVLEPEIAGGAAIRALFSQGIGSWLTRGNIEFPCELFALANSLEAETLLQGFNFFKVQNAKAMMHCRIRYVSPPWTPAKRPGLFFSNQLGYAR